MVNPDYKILFDNAGSAAGVDIIGDWQTHYGGQGDFWVWGNLGGGEVYLEAALDETAPCRLCDVSISGTSNISAGVAKFYLAAGTRIRAVLINSISESSGIYARINT